MIKQVVESDTALAIANGRASVRRKSNGCVGIFSHFFDWNRRFSKKKLLPQASSSHGDELFRRDDEMTKAKLFKVENGEGKKKEMKSPGLVFRLMGLENLPINKNLEGGDLRLVKAKSDCQMGEESQLKSVISSYRKHRHYHHHKLSSPKSPKLVPSKNASKASKLIDVAWKILEPSNRAKPALSYDLTGQSAVENSDIAKSEAARVHWKGRDQGIVSESVQLNRIESREGKQKMGNRRRQWSSSGCGKYANDQANNSTSLERKEDLKEAALGKYLEKKIRELGFCEDEKISFNGAMRKKSIAVIFHDLINALNAEKSSSPSQKDFSSEGNGNEERYAVRNLKPGNDTHLKGGSFEKVVMVKENGGLSRGRWSRKQLSFVNDVMSDVEVVQSWPISIEELDAFVGDILPYIGGLGFGERVNGKLRRFAFDCVVEVFDMKYGSQLWEILPSMGDVMLKEVAQEVSQWEANYEKGHLYDACEKWTNLDIGEEVGNQILHMLVKEVVLEV